MPRDGSLVLTDLQQPKLRLLCEKCRLRRQYDVQQLINHIGNARILALIPELARRNGCERIRAPGPVDQCGLQMRRPNDPVWIASATTAR